RRYLEPTIAFPDARPLCCCESRWQQRTFAFNSSHLTMERRVQHPTLNDRSATHVFVAAIGTTAFLRSTAVRFGSLADICSAKRHVRFAPKSGHVRCKRECPLWAKSGHNTLLRRFVIPRQSHRVRFG